MKKAWERPQKYKNVYGKSFFLMLEKIKPFTLTQKETFILTLTLFHVSNFWAMKKIAEIIVLNKKEK